MVVNQLTAAAAAATAAAAAAAVAAAAAAAATWSLVATHATLVLVFAEWY